MMMMMIMMMILIRLKALIFCTGKDGQKRICFNTIISCAQSMLLEIHFRRQTNKEANKQKHTTVLSGIVSFLATDKTLGCFALSLPFARSPVADDNDNSMVINC